jgi:hypothetical protein
LDDFLLYQKNCDCFLINKENSFLKSNSNNKKSIQTNKSKLKSRRLNKTNYNFVIYPNLVDNDELLSKVKYIGVFKKFNTFVIFQRIFNIK